MKNCIIVILNLIFSYFPIKKNKLLFISYYGGQYGCSPKYLSQYISTKHKDWNLIWAFTNPKKYELEGILKVKYLSFRYFYELATSHIIISNFRMPNHFKKRKSQLYIQTWHSSLRLKKSEGDIEDKLFPSYVKMAKTDAKQTDIILSGCKFNTNIFERAFWHKGKILEYGIPRNDIFFKKDKEKIIESVKNNLGIKEDQKIILYAPTFRQNKKPEEYILNIQRLSNFINNELEGDWVILLRLHPHLSGYKLPQLEGNNVFNVTYYDDIQELLLISDILITDYSSLMFDFMETKRPAFLYVPDLKEYLEKERDLYFDINNLPFYICNNIAELELGLKNYNIENYQNNLEFFKKEIGSFENGNACKNISLEIEKWMQNNF